MDKYGPKVMNKGKEKKTLKFKYDPKSDFGPVDCKTGYNFTPLWKAVNREITLKDKIEYMEGKSKDHSRKDEL